MTDPWNDLIHGDRWGSPGKVWVEDGTEYSWTDVGHLASAIEEAIRDHGAVRVVRVTSGSKLGCFAGQLAAWRAHCVAVVDHDSLGQGELDHVRPELTVAVSGDRNPTIEVVRRSDARLPESRIPTEVVAVNFTSGTTGSRRAVAVTRGNLLALFACRGLDVPVNGGPTSGSFATPTYDGWWFDTWRTVGTGGAVVCLPSVNEDVFAWPELVQKYHIDRVLLPAAVVATLVEVAPACIADIPWLFSGGEQFKASTYRRARDAGLTNRFVNLYGPTEATFATHKYELPDTLTAGPTPIGKPLDGCRQSLREVEGQARTRELVVSGPFVCLGYLEKGTLARRFESGDRQALFRTGDLVRVRDDGSLVFVGRLDSQIKVNGIRVDAAALEQQVTEVSQVSDCRVVQDEQSTVAFVLTDVRSTTAPAVRSRIESIVKGFSPAISVRLTDRWPVKPGGKIDTASLMTQHCATGKDGEK